MSTGAIIFCTAWVAASIGWGYTLRALRRITQAWKDDQRERRRELNRIGYEVDARTKVRR